MKIFLIALVIRIITFELLFDKQVVLHDSKEYFNNSAALQVVYTGKLDYSEWFQRSPAYMLYLNLTNRNLFLQVILSAFTVLLLWKINHIAGWIYCFYPNHILYSGIYLKETLLIFLFVAAFRLLKDHKKHLVYLLPVILLGFVSYNGVFDYNLEVMNKGIMQNAFELWAPKNPVLTTISGEMWNYVLLLPYLALIYLFVKHIDLTSPEFLLVIIWTVAYSLIFGDARYREPLLPIIIVSVIEKMKGKNCPILN